MTDPDEREKIEKQAEFERNMATLGDMLPGHWRRIYENLKTEGFTESQAMDLLKAYITKRTD